MITAIMDFLLGLIGISVLLMILLGIWICLTFGILFLVKWIKENYTLDINKNEKEES